MNTEYKFVVSALDQNRLDKFLVEKLPDYSRSRIQSFIRNGNVLVNQDQITKGGMRVENGDIIHIAIPPIVESNLVPEEIALDIIFENSDIIVVNKPAGMVVHPAVGHSSGTLVHAALHHAPGMEGIGGELRPGIVHRLDKDTSGIILLAKNDKTHRFLQDQFRNRSIQKTYYALVDGHPPTNTGRVEAPIGRDPSHRKQMAIVPIQRGREAITEYKVIEKYENHCLISVHPHTGRTHQIRLHLAFLGCPIVGDKLYGHRKLSIVAKRQMLHAYKIEIMLPGESTKRMFEAKLPEDMQKLIQQLTT
ncbi:MAG TPA: RluA family pseudouridine synthase [Anaerolineaceae bacterium]|nr:RluA family pseudouridine synthase [Anaerolineaceae bacterium]